MRQIAKSFLVSFGSLVPLCAPSSSIASQISAQCPIGAISQVDGNPRMNWEAVHSEMEARACIKRIAETFDAEQMKNWFSDNGFGRPVITRVGKNTYLNAGWPIHQNGLLFKENIWLTMAHKIAYAMSFGVHWRDTGTVEVYIKYTYE